MNKRNQNLFDRRLRKRIIAMLWGENARQNLDQQQRKYGVPKRKYGSYGLNEQRSLKEITGEAYDPTHDCDDIPF